jgi:hypothetical protein
MNVAQVSRRYGLVVVIFIVTSIPAAAWAQVLKFTQTGVGSGSLNGVPFAATDFTITSVADTAGRFSQLPGILEVDNTSASIFIDGVGNFEFLTGTRLFVNHADQMVGLSRSASVDLFQGPTAEVFQTWDMHTPVALTTGTGRLIGWGDSPWPQVYTTGGVLLFDNTVGTVPVTFSAELVPEPASLAMVAGCGLAALARRRRRG